MGEVSSCYVLYFCERRDPLKMETKQLVALVRDDDTADMIAADHKSELKSLGVWPRWDSWYETEKRIVV